jgi:hypothetical protein
MRATSTSSSRLEERDLSHRLQILVEKRVPLALDVQRLRLRVANASSGIPLQRPWPVEEQETCHSLLSASIPVAVTSFDIGVHGCKRRERAPPKVTAGARAARRKGSDCRTAFKICTPYRDTAVAVRGNHRRRSPTSRRLARTWRSDG